MAISFLAPLEALGSVPSISYEMTRDGRWVVVRPATHPSFVQADGVYMGWPPKGVIPERWYRYDKAIVEAATKYGLDPVLLKAILWEESRFASHAKSHAGAQGIGQLMPSTAKTLGVANPFDPVECIWGSAAHLRRTANKFATQNMVVLIAAYNSGDKAVEGALHRARREADERLLQFIPRNKETPGYVLKVLWTFDRIHRGVA